ncbi:MAG TPA: hypothetical protein PLM93_09315 [Sulfuricurvum sp.]|nr:MAG: hypothetical protein B7Y30_07370 [Campylobacterales bacterium 16-40-21]OZA02462.1 MAG: hypothetical protein B7X89_08965 [Sulfuricurvum sp. 17-40-25]HQS67366.1 hypothetical protein [Sulfuricurvum sp.]HQT36117.1 hypothetical protein [Sulfuricurvum sp.]
MKIIITTLLIVTSLLAEEDLRVKRTGPLGVEYFNPSKLSDEYFPKTYDKNHNYGTVLTEKRSDGYSMYKVNVFKLGKVNTSAKSEEIFFGKANDYYALTRTSLQYLSASVANGTLSSLQQSAGTIASKGSEALGAGLAGAGIGLFFGGLVTIKDHMNSDYEYVKVMKLTDTKGASSKMITFFVCNADAGYSESQIRGFMAKKEQE